MEELGFAHGMRLVLDDGRVSEVIDRHGHRLARIAWRGGRMSSAMIWGSLDVPPLAVSAAMVAHPVLGDAHALSCGAVMSAIDWASPRRIPAIDRPSAIPPGAGTMLLDLIALCAQQAGVAALPYDGPYPTHALWASLAQCFRPLGAATVEAFVAGERVTYAPVCFERHHIRARMWIQLRDTLERASIEGRDYARGSGARRLVALPDGEFGEVAAEVWIADAPLARIAVFDAEGELCAGPFQPPPFASSVLGREFPPPLREALAELVAGDAPSPLAAIVRELVARTPMRWADLGVDLARDARGSIEVHAAIWERLAPLGLARVALALAEAITPIVTRLAAAELAARVR